MFLAQFELLAFSVLSVYLFGWEIGYYIWILYQIFSVFSAYGWSAQVRWSYAGLGFLVFVLTAVFVRPLEPYYDLSSAVRNTIFYANFVSFFMTYMNTNFTLFRATENAEIDAFESHRQTRSLLLNILPEVIANRLEKSEELIADKIDNSSILFSDLVGFTEMSSKKTAEEVVTILDEVVKGFDSIVEEEGLEKIKTIGDGYMAASGVPETREDHAVRAVSCGLRLLDFVTDYNKTHGTQIALRVGVHSGPLVAGVIGRHKFSYDLWGDTVNTAARMESHGVPGKIQISGDTFRLVKDHCDTERREGVNIKGKGVMDTYIVTGLSRS